MLFSVSQGSVLGLLDRHLALHRGVDPVSAGLILVGDDRVAFGVANRRVTNGDATAVDAAQVRSRPDR